MYGDELRPIDFSKDDWRVSGGGDGLLRLAIAAGAIAMLVLALEPGSLAVQFEVLARRWLAVRLF